MGLFLQAAADAAGALNHARQSRTAVDRTLREVNSLMAQLSESNFPVFEKRSWNV